MTKLSEQKAHWLAGIQVSADTNDPERGCGQKKENAFYLEATISIDGVLSAWSWLLPGVRKEPVYTSLPSRSQVLIDLDGSLSTRSPIIWGTPVQNLGIIPDVPCIADHVGESFYTPFQFKQEVIRFGPSRRTNPQQAKLFSQQLDEWGKLLIAFEAKLPVFSNAAVALEARDLCIRMLQLEDEYDDTEDTWTHPDFTSHTWGYKGEDSWLIPILMFLDIQKREPETIDADPDDLARFDAIIETVPYRNQLFGFTWITKLTYTLGDQERDDLDQYPVLNVVNLDWVHSNDPALHCGMIIFDLDTIAESGYLRPEAKAWFKNWSGSPQVAITTYQSSVGAGLIPGEFVTGYIGNILDQIMDLTGKDNDIPYLAAFYHPGSQPLEDTLSWSEDWAIPNPGMLQWLIRKFRLVGNNRAPIYVGCDVADEEAARSAGVKFFDREAFFAISGQDASHWSNKTVDLRKLAQEE
jgi:hypothetical protein